MRDVTVEVDDQGGRGGQPVGDDRPDDADGGEATDELIDDGLVDVGGEPPGAATLRCCGSSPLPPLSR